MKLTSATDMILYDSTVLDTLRASIHRQPLQIESLSMLKRTKIVATLGPSTDKAGILEELIRSGVNVVRLNFSHGSADDHRRRAKEVKETARRLGKVVAVLGDLQGPKFVLPNSRTTKSS